MGKSISEFAEHKVEAHRLTNIEMEHGKHLHKHLQDRDVFQNQLAKALKDYEFNYEELHAQYTQ